MTNRNLFAISLASAMCVVLAACGGGGGQVASASTVAPPSGPTPPPPSTVSADTPLVAPIQSTAPAVIETTSASTTIHSEAAVNISLPVTQTAVASNFGGDAIDTARNKSFWPNFIGDGPYLTYTGGGWNLAARLGPGSDLDWTMYGYWDPFPYSGLPHISRGAWVAGFQTPLSTIPIIGTAHYSGQVIGLHSNSVGQISGDVTLQADFAARSLSGSMTNLMVQAAGVLPGSMNNVSFTATFATGLNRFNGTTLAGPAPNSPWAFAAGATGDLTGHFYGPTAQEVGAVWTLSDGPNRAIGSFGARKN